MSNIDRVTSVNLSIRSSSLLTMKTRGRGGCRGGGKASDAGEVIRRELIAMERKQELADAVIWSCLAMVAISACFHDDDTTATASKIFKVVCSSKTWDPGGPALSYYRGAEGQQSSVGGVVRAIRGKKLENCSYEVARRTKFSTPLGLPRRAVIVKASNAHQRDSRSSSPYGSAGQGYGLLMRGA